MPHCIDYCISKISANLLNVYTPARPLRSSLDPNILNIAAAARSKSHGQRPVKWNTVPGGIRTFEEKETLKNHLKTALFSRQDE
jgi:hypothetical protein